MDRYSKYKYFIGYTFIFSLVILKLFVTKGSVLFSNLKKFEFSYSDPLESFFLFFRIIRKVIEDIWEGYFNESCRCVAAIVQDIRFLKILVNCTIKYSDISLLGYFAASHDR